MKRFNSPSKEESSRRLPMHGIVPTNTTQWAVWTWTEWMTQQNTEVSDTTDIVPMDLLQNHNQETVAKNCNTVQSRLPNFYRMAGNIGGNYIVWFHEKFTVFLFVKLSIAFCYVHNVTPMRRVSFSALEKSPLLLLFSFELKEATA